MFTKSSYETLAVADGSQLPLELQLIELCDMWLLLDISEHFIKQNIENFRSIYIHKELTSQKNDSVIIQLPFANFISKYLSFNLINEYVSATFTTCVFGHDLFNQNTAIICIFRSALKSNCIEYWTKVFNFLTQTLSSKMSERSLSLLFE